VKHVMLFLAVVCAGASFVFFDAAASGANSTAQVCLAAGELCQRSLTFAAAAAALAALWLMVALASSLVDHFECHPKQRAGVLCLRDYAKKPQRARITLRWG
jgi:hypothetical protein